jgi:cytochrome P450
MTDPIQIPIHPFLATADGDRHAAYQALSAHGPVHRLPTPAGVPVWMITGYQAARAAFADPRIVKAQGGVPFGELLPAEVTEAIDHHLLALNPPDHGRLRRLVSAAFTRRRCDLLAPRIQALTDELLTELDARGDASVDLLSEFAYPLPLTVICELLGIPDGDRGRFRAWTGPLMAGRMAGFETYRDAAVALVDYLRELLAAKRRNPADDLLSALIAVRDEGDRLTEDELTSMVFLLLVAGHETTVNLIANGVLALLTHPDQLATLRAEPERIDAAVEELLRFDGPLQSALPAQTVADVELDGVLIPAGETVVISVLAANRDPARQPDADRLDLSRPEASHLAFGHGIHHCLGAPLARLEARIALSTLLDRFPDLHLAGPAQELTRTSGLLMNGLVALPVVLR